MTRTKGIFEQIYHVASLEDLTPFARTISVERKRTVPLTHGLLSKIHTSPNRDLAVDDNEQLGENVHQATLPVGHADLTIKQLANDALNSPTTRDGEGMAVMKRRPWRFHARNSFL